MRTRAQGAANAITDVAEHFVDPFQVAQEEGQNGRRDPWLLLLRCANGHVYPHGGELLSAATERRGPVAERFASLVCVTVTQDGDEGINAVFHVRDFGRVAAAMKPCRRRPGWRRPTALAEWKT